MVCLFFLSRGGRVGHVAVDGALIVFGCKGRESGLGFCGAQLCGWLYACGTLLLGGVLLLLQGLGALLCQGLFACELLLLGTLAGGGLDWLALLL